MNVFQTAELAALVSVHSPHLIECADPLADEPLQAYWVHSRRRHALWREGLETSPIAGLSDVRPALVEEVFVTEMLTRVWTGVLSACDTHRRMRHGEPLARSIFLDHLECRCRAMQFLVHESSMSGADLARVDRLRRRTERWTDALLAHVIRQHDVSEYAFDPRRAREFANDGCSRDIILGRGNLIEFVLAGLRFAFANVPPKQPLDEASHTAVLKSVVACFPSDVFHTHGSLKSIAAARLARSGQHPERNPTVTWPLPDSCGPASSSEGGSPRGIRFSDLRRPRSDS